jgi:hypothetical protein
LSPASELLPLLQAPCRPTRRPTIDVRNRLHPTSPKGLPDSNLIDVRGKPRTEITLSEDQLSPERATRSRARNVNWWSLIAIILGAFWTSYQVYNQVILPYYIQQARLSWYVGLFFFLFYLFPLPVYFGMGYLWGFVHAKSQGRPRSGPRLRWGRPTLNARPVVVVLLIGLCFVGISITLYGGALAIGCNYSDSCANSVWISELGNLLAFGPLVILARVR